jgi:hypothetical protein
MLRFLLGVEAYIVPAVMNEHPILHHRRMKELAGAKASMMKFIKVRWVAS